MKYFRNSSDKKRTIACEKTFMRVKILFKTEWHSNSILT